MPLDPHLRILHDHGWRSVLAVPVLRRDRMVGALVIHRKVPGDFGPETLRMLETFAAQSALAILNARLFRDLDRSRVELEVARGTSRSSSRACRTSCGPRSTR